MSRIPPGETTKSGSQQPVVEQGETTPLAEPVLETVEAEDNEAIARRMLESSRSLPSPEGSEVSSDAKPLSSLTGGVAVRGGQPPPRPDTVRSIPSTKDRISRQDPLPVHPGEPRRQDELMVATYNVENLFDTTDDPQAADEDFTPQGRLAWTNDKLDKKIENLGRVIRSTNGGTGPDFVALVEVENRAVVEDLNEKGLSGLGYRTIAHIEGEDHRGIDNAILSKFPLAEPPKLHQVHNPDDPVWKGYTTRGILEATFDVDGRPLTVFVNHWPSRRGGSAAEARRMQAAEKMRGLIDQKLEEDPGREIILLGDFNATPGEESLALLSEGSQGVVNTLGQTGPEVGTHYYHPKHEWSTFDHILVSRSLLDNSGFAWVPGSTEIVKEPFMVTSSGAPKRFYQPRIDPKNQDLSRTGYSDHLPVVARLRRVSA